MRKYTVCAEVEISVLHRNHLDLKMQQSGKLGSTVFFNIFVFSYMFRLFKESFSG